MQRPRNSGQLIKEIERILTEQISDPRLNVNYLASLLNVSTACIYQCMCQTYLENPKTVIESSRIYFAIRLMSTNPDMTLHKVAVQSGYSSYRSFSRCFERMIGVVPSEYASLPISERMKIQVKLRAHFIVRIKSGSMRISKFTRLSNN